MNDSLNYTYEELVESAKEHKSCFGQYYDGPMICEDGAAGLCSHCAECRRESD